jgi:hypothetical protein
MTVCAQFSQRSTCPPSAAVRQRSIADMTFNWSRLTCPALAERHAAPWLRKISATSSFGRNIAAGDYADGSSVLVVSLFFCGAFCCGFLDFLRGCDSRSSGLLMLAIMPVATRV